MTATHYFRQRQRLFSEFAEMLRPLAEKMSTGEDREEVMRLASSIERQREELDRLALADAEVQALLRPYRRQPAVETRS